MLKIGITGGIGSGKSTVCKVFELLNIPVFYADDVAKSIMHTDEELKQGIIKTFGERSYDNGSLNRPYIAGIVFNDERELEKLNALVHPAVFRAFDQWVIAQKQAPYVLKEAALLFESESFKMCDYSILVTAPYELKLKRIMARDGISEEQVQQRMEKQLTDEQKEKLANFFVENDEHQLVIPQVLELHRKFLSLK
jgi:dephospho-CoA kinase